MRPNRWHEGSSLDFLILDLTDLPLQQAVAVGMVISLLDDLLGADDSNDTGSAGILEHIDTGPVGVILGRADSIHPLQESF
jgi:hypothetical protein